MKLVLVLTSVLLSGCASAAPTTSLPSLDERPVTNACLTDPPPATDTFNVGMCKTLLGLDEEQRDHQRAWAKNEIPGCDAVCRYPSEKAREDREAIELGKARAAQPTSPLTVPTRHAPPQCNAACQARYRQAVRDAQMDDASFEAELRAANRNPFLGEAPATQREPISCTSYQLGMFTQTDCY